MNSLTGPHLAQVPCIPSRTSHFGQVLQTVEERVDVLKTMEERVDVLLKETLSTEIYLSKRPKFK